MSKDSGSPVDLAAAIYGCKVEELLSYHEFEDGSVAIIAPTGQKFTYPVETLLARLVQQIKEERAVATDPGVDIDGHVTKDAPAAEDSGHLASQARHNNGHKNDSGVTVPATADDAPAAESSLGDESPAGPEVGDPGLVTETAAPEAGHVTGHLASQAKHNDSVVTAVPDPGTSETPKASLISGPQGRGGVTKHKRSAAKRKSAKRANPEADE